VTFGLVLQRREALSDENLPEEYRIALAKAFVDDLFYKVMDSLAKFEESVTERNVFSFLITRLLP
jgi:hypothetical protein